MKKVPIRWFIYIALIVGLSFVLVNRETKSTTPSKSFSYLESQIVQDKVQRISWDPNGFVASVRTKNNSLYTVSIPAVNTTNEGFARILKLSREHKVEVKALPYSSGSDSLLMTIVRSLPMILFAALLIFILRSQGLFSSKAIKPVTSKATFDDVAGCDEAIIELQDVRSFLEDPKRYKEIGAKVPKGVLLYGPPGTGKTLLARAVANEAGIPFYSASGSEFIEMFAGLGARRVRTLFEQAKKTAPSIIFIDELDAVGGKRSGGGGDGAQKEADQTLIQILKEMDGFDVQDNPVIVMGATNRLETLDAALTRPGRFDRHIAVDPPDREGRLEVLKVHAQDKKLDSDVDLELIATQTAGMTGASLAQLLNEAALLAARDRQTKISFRNIDDAYFRIVAGAKKQNRALNDEERKTVAYHEIGHAFVGEKFKGSNKVHKISIIPRGQSGGQTLYVSDEDVFLHKEQDLRDQIAALLGGRASEEIFFGRLTSGARDDLRRATNIAMAMVTQLGMSKTLGLIVETDEHRLSEEIDNQAKAEVKLILEQEYQRAKAVLEDNKEIAAKAAEALLEEETLDRARFLELIGMPMSAIENEHLKETR